MPRDELFDMAVNRAAAYAGRLGALDGRRDAGRLREVLELWYLKTRFAYRVPLESVVDALLSYPGSGHHWSGGVSGDWLSGDNPRP